MNHLLPLVDTTKSDFSSSMDLSGPPFPKTLMRRRNVCFGSSSQKKQSSTWHGSLQNRIRQPGTTSSVPFFQKSDMIQFMDHLFSPVDTSKSYSESNMDRSGSSFLKPCREAEMFGFGFWLQKRGRISGIAASSLPFSSAIKIKRQYNGCVAGSAPAGFDSKGCLINAMTFVVQGELGSINMFCF